MTQVITRKVLRDGSKFKTDFKNKTDGLLLLADINSNCIPAAFFDPQYRGVLDKLHYGNEGQSRGKSRSQLTQMHDNTIIQFLREINRVLSPSGHCFLWVDKFHLCQGTTLWFSGTDLKIVDLITWDTTFPGIQFYTANFLEAGRRGKGAITYGPRHGFCLETQFFPDTPNHANFPSVCLNVGDVFDHTTVFSFTGQN